MRSRIIKWLRILIEYLKPEDNVIDFQEATGGETLVTLGRYANSLLKNPAFDAATKKIEREIFNAWKTSPPKEKEAREHLYYRIEMLYNLKLKLHGMVKNMIYEEKKKQGQ